MSPAILAGVAGALVAVAAAALLWRESIRHESSVRMAYRAFAVAALLWGAGFVAQEGMAATGTGTSLTFADLLTLLALPALGVGLFGLARASREADGDDRQDPQARSAAAWLVDACLLATALFIVDWVALFGAEYRRTGESAGAFTLQAIHPIADLVALGVLLALAVRAGRPGLAPYLALLVVTVGDSLAVGARISDMRPGVWAVIAALAGFCLLGAAALARGDAAAPAPPRLRLGWLEPVGLPGATLAAALAAAVAALIVIGWALSGGSFAEPAVVICGGVAALALVARITDLLRRERSTAAVSAESEHRFRELADRTSDVVLICDRDGIIRYASPAVGEYGYTSAELAGRSLSELIHPEDRAAGVRTVRAVGAGRQPGRLRAGSGRPTARGVMSSPRCPATASWAPRTGC